MTDTTDATDATDAPTDALDYSLTVRVTGETELQSDFGGDGTHARVSRLATVDLRASFSAAALAGVVTSHNHLTVPDGRLVEAAVERIDSLDGRLDTTDDYDVRVLGSVPAWKALAYEVAATDGVRIGVDDRPIDVIVSDVLRELLDGMDAAGPRGRLALADALFSDDTADSPDYALDRLAPGADA
jgi:hypothetical protein